MEARKPTELLKVGEGLSSIVVTSQEKGVSGENVKAVQVKQIARSEQEINSEVTSIILAWRKAWENKDLNEFLGYYSNAFKFNGKGLEEWKENRRKNFSVRKNIKIKLNDIKIIPEDDGILASFKQIYRSDKVHSTGLKNLFLKKEGNQWKIFKQRWLAPKG